MRRRPEIALARRARNRALLAGGGKKGKIKRVDEITHGEEARKTEPPDPKKLQQFWEKVRGIAKEWEKEKKEKLERKFKSDLINNEADLINYLEELKNTTLTRAEFLMRAKLLRKHNIGASLHWNKKVAGMFGAMLREKNNQ